MKFSKVLFLPLKISKICVLALSYHFRWNPDYIPTILQPGTVVITTIRDPLTTFRSVYNYFYLNREGKGSKCDMPCWKEPFSTFLDGEEGVPIEEYLGQ